MLQRAAVRPDGRYRRASQGYADAHWQAVDHSTGPLPLKSFGPTQLLDHAALVRLYALPAWPQQRYLELT